MLHEVRYHDNSLYILLHISLAPTLCYRAVKATEWTSLRFERMKGCLSVSPQSRTRFHFFSLCHLRTQDPPETLPHQQVLAPPPLTSCKYSAAPASLQPPQRRRRVPAVASSEVGRFKIELDVMHHTISRVSGKQRTPIKGFPVPMTVAYISNERFT